MGYSFVTGTGLGKAVQCGSLVHNSMGPNDRYRPPLVLPAFSVTMMLVRVMALGEQAGLESCRSRLWGPGDRISLLQSHTSFAGWWADASRGDSAL